jgi:hypothetical protein
MVSVVWISVVMVAAVWSCLMAGVPLAIFV